MKIIPPDFFRAKMAEFKRRINYDSKTGVPHTFREGKVLLEPIYAEKGVVANTDYYVLGNEKAESSHYVYFKRAGGVLSDRDVPFTLILKDSGEMWFVPKVGEPAHDTIAELFGNLAETK